MSRILSTAALVLTVVVLTTAAHECFQDKLHEMQGEASREVIHVDYPESFILEQEVLTGRRQRHAFDTQASAISSGSGSNASAAPATPVPTTASVTTPQTMRVTVVWDPDGDGYCSKTGATVKTYTDANVVCREDDVLSSIKKDYVVNTLMVKSKEWIQTALNVIRVQGNMVVSGTNKCGTRPGVTVPEADRTTGQADTDFLIYVTAVPMSDPESATVAWALACRFDDNGRPLVGHVNWVPSKLTNADKGNAVQEAEDVYTGIHEIMHALGFSKPFFGTKGYLNADGSGYTSGGTSTSTSSTLGKTITKITSPRVITKAREHFGCSSLDGLEIEDQGGSGTAGSHWEKRIMYQDVMNGVGSNVASFISQMTLAYFEDTGHYTANYGASDPGMTWGYQKGCDFLTKKCITSGSANSDEYCTSSDQTERLCTHDRLGMGMCDVATYNSALPTHMQYFSDAAKGAQVSVTDYCPTVIPFSNTKCIDSSNTDQQDIYGNDYTSSSRCYESNLIEVQYSSPDKGTRCFITSCTSSGAIEISIEGEIAKCPTDGSAGDADTGSLSNFFKGWIKCPKASLVCNSAQFAPPTPSPPTPAPTPLPPGQTYAPTRAPPTPPPTIAQTCAGRKQCADNNNLMSLMPACRQLADEIVDCFGTNCDGAMLEWMTAKGLAAKCATLDTQEDFKLECQEAGLGVRDICYLVNGGVAEAASLALALLATVALTLF